MAEWRAYLDLYMVPVAFIVYLGYHLLLLYRMLTFPERTYFGSEIRQRRINLDFIIRMDVRDRGACVAEISSSMTLANTFGSYSATLISFIGGLVMAKRAVIEGNSGAVTGAVKCGVLLVFALAAFLCFKVGAKILGHANFLINMPHPAAQHDYIDGVVVRGFVLIEIGNRSFYFSLALATWLLGPMPMLVACLVLLVGLYIKDKHTIPLEDSNRHIELSSA